MDILEKTRQEFIEIIRDNGWDDEYINVVSAHPLSASESIGCPDRQDYPILKGREVMIEALFRGSKGQAYTDQPGNYAGTLKNVADLSLNDNFERAVFIATLNAVLRFIGAVDRTVHCRDEEPGICAGQLVGYIHEHFGSPKIAFIGLQPGMVAELSRHFKMRVVDLDIKNIGKKFDDVVVEDIGHTQDIIDWADIILATGSTSVNNSLNTFITEKPTVFYGVTISGIAYLNELERYCPCSH